MNKILFILLTAFSFLNAQTFDFQYISPKPDAIMVPNKTNIIFRHSDDINPGTISDNLIRVVGTKSGPHKGELILSDDAKTIVFNPFNPFADSETVEIQFINGLKTLSGININAFSFNFTTASGGIIQRYDAAFGAGIDQEAVFSADFQISQNLPAPPITIHMVDNPSPGYIFMATWDRNIPHVYGNFIFILDNSGTIVDSVRVNGAPYDLQVQPNGLLSYALGNFSGIAPGEGEELQHIVRDSNLAIVDSFKMKNGYETDFHEFLLLPNGHAMLMSYHTILYDMSKIVEGGRTDASLIINIIQEQDKDKNVVFEWRNIDYIPITDTDLNLTDPRINYGTLNAFSIDTDGNILASFRNHSEIMKISRATGEVMWRWGSTRGEFTFIGEHEENGPFFFARQHHIKRLQNGNVTIFDNGQFHVPPYSRAVEYALDEVNKTATLVSEFRYPAGNIFAAAAGNAQKLADGGWFIGYGILSPQSPVKRNIVETHADGSIAFEISLPNNVIAYRASKSAWRESVHKPSVTRYELFGGNMYDFNDPSNITGVSIDFIDLVSYSYNYATVTRLPYAPLVPEFFGELPAVYPVSVIYEGAAIDSHTPDIHIDLTVYPEIIDPATTSIYWRQFPNNGLFLQMPTTYDNNNNELITRLSGFGELVFGSTGYEYAANPPILYEPVNKIKLLALESIALRWTGQGLFDAFNIQVSNDSLFNVILVDTTLDASLIFVNNIVNHTTYYWRVRSILGVDESAWSPVWRFSTTDPFIEMISPNGAEEWYLGSKEVIRWETNILDTVLIDLLKDQQIYTSIGEIPGKIDAFAWKIPENLPASSEYAIQIRSKLDTNLSAIGKDSFSLIDTINTGISNYLDMIPDAFTLDQNYPNPFNPETNIQFEVPQSAYITLKVFNIKGALVATLTDGQLPAGRYTLRFTATNLASGIYFYTLQSSGFKQVRKMMFLK